MVNNYFLDELILGFGFIEGLFTRLGIGPEGDLINTIISLAPEPLASQMNLLILLVGFNITIFTWVLIYSLCGKLGVIAVVLSTIVGLIFASNDYFYYLYAPVY